tara:strand:+ start:6460 stop:6867 length:408 start_codon:yes stop_codon:yes gene_type:complete
MERIGKCLCENISYSFDSTSVISASHCHCKDCQRSTGSGKATIIMINENTLKIKGKLKYFTVSGTDGAEVSRGFCEECGSPLISKIKGMEGIKLIKAGGLDDSSWVTVDSNFWGDSAENWSPVDVSKHTFPKNPS